MKSIYNIIIFAAIVNLTGQIFRIAAEHTAKANFTFTLAEEKKETHVLITHGVYSIIRHPSYFGFYYATLANQLLLMNPIFFVLFGVLLWIFYCDRIINEEILLKKFFGEEYIKYASITPIGIPFIQRKINEKYLIFE